MVIATDKTKEIQALKQLEQEKQQAKFFHKLIKYRYQFKQFFLEVNEMLDQLLHRCQEVGENPIEKDLAMRILHTVKGSSASFHLTAISERAHHLETKVTQMEITRGSALVPGLEEIRAELDKVQTEFKDVIGSRDGVQGIRYTEIGVDRLLRFRNTLAAQGIDGGIIREFGIHFIGEPITLFFSHFQDLANNIAEKQGKKIKPLNFEKSAVRIAPEPYRDLFFSYVHAIRNAIDHGIEMPNERKAGSKNEAGSLTFRFYLVRTPGSWVKEPPSGTGPWLLIEFFDDGRGIDAERVRKKLIERGLQAEAQQGDDAVIQHIFDAGLSTKDTVTEISGRGVGMDAILHAARKLGGTAQVMTRRGKGTLLAVIVPYIHPGIVQLGEQVCKPSDELVTNALVRAA